MIDLGLVARSSFLLSRPPSIKYRSKQGTLTFHLDLPAALWAAFRRDRAGYHVRRFLHLRYNLESMSLI